MSGPLIFKYILFKQFGGDLSRIKTGEKRWNSFIHNGVLFQAPYIHKKIPLKFKNVDYVLEPEAEEAAFMYAKYIDTEYIKNKTFNRNFFHDFKKILGKSHPIDNLEDCDFSSIYKYIVKEKEQKKELSKEEKEKVKEKKDKTLEKFKICKIDGEEQNVGNYAIEPCSIFIGRGCNPYLGKIKKRVNPSDVILNLSKEAPISKPYYMNKDYELVELPGKWKEVIHDNTLVWLASYKDDITGKVKYVWTAADSKFKAESDQEKFDLAKQLRQRIGKIRQINAEKLRSSDIKEQQIATALYLIDMLGIRVGTEKNDTEVVGATTLQVKNIELKENLHIKLDFIGKDSIPYTKEIQVEEIVYNNLKNFMNNKDKNDEIFDKMTATELNNYLQDLMPGLTAKVFRTYKASDLMQDELIKIMRKYDEKKVDKEIILDDLLNEYIKANLKVSIMCNHVKNVSKNFKESIHKFDEKIKELKEKKKEYEEKKKKDQVEKINKKIKELKGKRELKSEMKSISLDTAKQNYIDPRISIAFLKKFNLDIDKIFSKKLQDKFKWALEVDESYRF